MSLHNLSLLLFTEQHWLVKYRQYCIECCFISVYVFICLQSEKLALMESMKQELEEKIRKLEEDKQTMDISAGKVLEIVFSLFTVLAEGSWATSESLVFNIFVCFEFLLQTIKWSYCFGKSFLTLRMSQTCGVLTKKFRLELIMFMQVFIQMNVQHLRVWWSYEDIQVKDYS